MRNVSLISEDRISDWEGDGPPILFTNPLIRRMLGVARAGREDTFFDLGSGWGQTLIIALTELGVKKAVGVEKDRVRHTKSRERLTKWKIPSKRWQAIRARFEDVLSGKIKGVDPREATIVYYGLYTDTALLKSIAKNLESGARLVYYYGCLFPEIMPTRVDFPFYVSVAPFLRPRSEIEWLSKVVCKKRSSIDGPGELGVQELWSELRHDYDVEGFGDPLRQYQARLRRSVSARDRIFK